MTRERIARRVVAALRTADEPLGDASPEQRRRDGQKIAGALASLTGRELDALARHVTDTLLTPGAHSATLPLDTWSPGALERALDGQTE